MLEHGRNTTREHFFGLDFMRAVAILLVLLCHFANVSSYWFAHAIPKWLPFSGSVGVDIFFALSGFLIGGLLLDIVEREPTIENLWIFLMRRWMRTLPLYFLWLAILLYLEPGSRYLWWRFALLIQNLAWPMPGHTYFYAVSWTLTFEEWFYILFGTLVILLAKYWNRQAAVLVGFLLFATIPLSVRFVLRDYWSLHPGIYSSVVLRLDTLAYGVGAALLLRWRPELLKYSVPSAIVGIAAISGAWFYWNRISLVILELIPTIGAVFCLPLALRWKAAPPIFGSVTSAVSRQSYGIYITHLTIIELVEHFWFAKRISAPEALLASIAITFALSFFIYKYFEAPILKLRPRQRFRAEHSHEGAPTRVGQIGACAAPKHP